MILRLQNPLLQELTLNFEGILRMIQPMFLSSRALQSLGGRADAPEGRVEDELSLSQVCGTGGVEPRKGESQIGDLISGDTNHALI